MKIKIGGIKDLKKIKIKAGSKKGPQGGARGWVLDGIYVEMVIPPIRVEISWLK